MSASSCIPIPPGSITPVHGIRLTARPYLLQAKTNRQVLPLQQKLASFLPIRSRQHDGYTGSKYMTGTGILWLRVATVLYAVGLVHSLWVLVRRKPELFQ